MQFVLPTVGALKITGDRTLNWLSTSTAEGRPDEFHAFTTRRANETLRGSRAVFFADLADLRIEKGESG
jgi:hypothetical protein